MFGGKKGNKMVNNVRGRKCVQVEHKHKTLQELENGNQKWIKWRHCKKDAKRGGDRRRPLVSSFLQVIGFSHWSKLFFSILLLSLRPAAPFFPLRGVKDKADGPNCVAGPCSQQWPFEANFPARRAEKGRERRTQRVGRTWMRPGGTGEVFRHVN